MSQLKAQAFSLKAEKEQGDADVRDMKRELLETEKEKTLLKNISWRSKTQK